MLAGKAGKEGAAGLADAAAPSSAPGGDDLGEELLTDDAIF